MMLMAAKGHFFTQIPHPMQRRSEMKEIFESGVTSMQSLPVRTTGHDFLHSWRHFYVDKSETCRLRADIWYLWLALETQLSVTCKAKMEARLVRTLSLLTMAIL